MTFGDRVLGALKLDANTFEDIERDPAAMGQAVGVIAISAVASGLANVWYGGISGIILGLITSLIGYALWATVVWLVGTKLMPDPATKADFPETFRVLGFAAAPGVLAIITIIPLLGWLLMVIVYPIIWLWSMAIMVIGVRQVLDYTDTFKAVIVVIIGFVAYLVFWGTVAMMGIGAAMVGGMMAH
ncbi:MAG: YIP1 family protein [Vicinamibacterales bacterium]